MMMGVGGVGGVAAVGIGGDMVCGLCDFDCCKTGLISDFTQCRVTSESKFRVVHKSSSKQ